MEVEFTPGDILSLLVEVERLVTRFRFHQHGGIERIALICFSWVRDGIPDVDFTEENVAAFEYPKGAAGNT